MVRLLPQLEFVHANPRQVEVVGLSPGFVHVCLDSRQALLYQATREAKSVVRMHDRGVSNKLTNSIHNDIPSNIHARLKTLGVAYK